MKLKNVSLTPGALLAELFGTFVLATVVITVANPIIVGFTLVVLVLAMGAVSGAHLNPAISFGLWSIRKLEGIKLPFYWAMQLLGAVLALLLSQFYQSGGYGISFASFGQMDAKLLVAELIGTAVFAFAVAAAVSRKELDSAKAFCVGLGLLTGLAVGGGLLGVAAQSLTTSSNAAQSRVAKVDGVMLNPAIALAASEKDDQSSQLQQQLGGATQDSKDNKQPASRFTLETVIGGLVGGALGMHLFMLIIGENPFKKKESVSAKVTNVFKKGKKEVKKVAKKTKK